jgi:hypothetical protein
MCPMSVPLDRLYHYINDLAQDIYGDPVIIYRFYPHGSKNISDLQPLLNYSQNQELTEWVIKNIRPVIWCNDQEPLDYDFYSKNFIVKPDDVFLSLLKSTGVHLPARNLNYRRQSIFKKNILLHSEQRSDNVKKYQDDNELIPVYYWSHAVIARDWFRYAEHVSQIKKPSKTFLVYNRAWSNTREYRLRFAELLITLNIQDRCKMSINPVEPELGIHYELHQFKNSIWRPRTVLENHFPISQAHSHYSADFDIEDYECTDIEVVLETLFDDSRLHLTEKSLRPIAVGQPFILAGTQGSLEYLRSYGFKTFGDVWDESYDLVEDPAERLIQIAELMKYISTWLPHQREHNMAEAQAIADYNRQHFFSQAFSDQVVDELKTNLTLTFAEINDPTNYYLDYWAHFLSAPDMINFALTNQEIQWPTKADLDYISELLKNKMQ